MPKNFRLNDINLKFIDFFTRLLWRSTFKYYIFTAKQESTRRVKRHTTNKNKPKTMEETQSIGNPRMAAAADLHIGQHYLPLHNLNMNSYTT